MINWYILHLSKNNVWRSSRAMSAGCVFFLLIPIHDIYQWHCKAGNSFGVTSVLWSEDGDLLNIVSSTVLFTFISSEIICKIICGKYNNVLLPYRTQNIVDILFISIQKKQSFTKRNDIFFYFPKYISCCLRFSIWPLIQKKKINAWSEQFLQSLYII